MIDAWARYRVKNLARWRAYHFTGRCAWALYRLQNKLFEHKSINDRLIEGRLYRGFL